MIILKSSAVKEESFFCSGERFSEWQGAEQLVFYRKLRTMVMSQILTVIPFLPDVSLADYKTAQLVVTF